MTEIQQHYSKRNYINSKFSHEFLDLINTSALANQVYDTCIYGNEDSKYNLIEQLTNIIFNQEKQLHEFHMKNTPRKINLEISK